MYTIAFILPTKSKVWNFEIQKDGVKMINTEAEELKISYKNFHYILNQTTTNRLTVKANLIPVKTDKGEIVLLKEVDEIVKSYKAFLPKDNLVPGQKLIVGVDELKPVTFIGKYIKNEIRADTLDKQTLSRYAETYLIVRTEKKEHPSRGNDNIYHVLYSKAEIFDILEVDYGFEENTQKIESILNGKFLENINKEYLIRHNRRWLSIISRDKKLNKRDLDFLKE